MSNFGTDGLNAITAEMQSLLKVLIGKVHLQKLGWGRWCLILVHPSSIEGLLLGPLYYLQKRQKEKHKH